MLTAKNGAPPIHRVAGRSRLRPLHALLVLTCLIGLAAGLLAHAARGDTATDLSLRASLSVVSSTDSRRFGQDCTPGTPATTECFDVRGGGTVRGLGRVSVVALNFVDTAPPGCPAGEFEVNGGPMRLSVSGKGTIELRLSAAAGCRTLATVLSHTRQYTVVAGTGVYAGASGSGTVRRKADFSGAGAAGTDLVTGTLSVPGLDFDLAPPRLSGGASRTVRAAKGANRARVTYEVAARDAVDGPVPVQCKPRSKSWFRIGRSLVRCSATDSSGNTARATFSVSVKRAK